jgi:hypothetical protein
LWVVVLRTGAIAAHLELRCLQFHTALDTVSLFGFWSFSGLLGPPSFSPIDRCAEVGVTSLAEAFAEGYQCAHDEIKGKG